MEIRFAKLSPTQNMTILVESAVPREQQPAVAAALMAYENVHAEQAGFVEPPADPAAGSRLQMAGGEFCGNATMSLAALLAWDRGLQPGQTAAVPLESSGVEGVLTCAVEMHTGYARATVAMPAPLGLAQCELEAAGKRAAATAVRMSGITHVVVPVSGMDAGWAAFAEHIVRERPDWLEDDAIGILLYDEQRRRIDPLVAVRSSGTTVWERGCGSGTAAVGAWLANRAQGPVDADIGQPGGAITVQARWERGRVSGLSITGDVRLVARGTAYIAV